MGWVARLKEWATRNPVERIDDTVLGPLVLNESYWQFEFEHSGRTVQIDLGGRYEPDPYAVERARHLRADFGSFAELVDSYLRTEAARPLWADFADEIQTLRISNISLWPQCHRVDGMVFFEDVPTLRCWRCDLNGTWPTGLGYDS